MRPETKRKTLSSTRFVQNSTFMVQVETTELLSSLTESDLQKYFEQWKEQNKKCE